jgi:hypothetical protein
MRIWKELGGKKFLHNQITIPEFAWAHLDKPRKLYDIAGSPPQIRNLRTCRTNPVHRITDTQHFYLIISFHADLITVSITIR